MKNFNGHTVLQNVIPIQMCIYLNSWDYPQRQLWECQSTIFYLEINQIRIECERFKNKFKIY